MGPIRVALIGLSSAAKTSWAAEGHLPYLLSTRGKSHYKVVALLNSSVKAAQAAREYFNLPSTVKIYGDPNEMAADPNIDLVVCNTRVDVHFVTTEPSLKAGKAVFIEWPLAENFKLAATLTDGKLCGNSIAGLQGRISPISIKVKQVLASGQIGRILSSDVRAFGNLWPRDAFPESLTYFSERRVGGNPITIAYAHMIDYVHDVLGEFASFESKMQLQRPTLGVVGKDGFQRGTVKSDVPDFLAVHGRLEKSKWETADDATLAVTFRNGPPFKGDPAFVWTINGEKGELMVTSPSGPYLNSDSYREQVKIELHDHSTDEVLNVEWDWKDWQKKLPVRSRSVAELYERYAHWVENGKVTSDLSDAQEWPRLHDAVVRHKELESLFEQYDAKERAQGV